MYMLRYIVEMGPPSSEWTVSACTERRRPEMQPLLTTELCARVRVVALAGWRCSARVLCARQ
jgi:hypothetical protein